MEKLELKHLAGYLPYELKVSIRDSHDLIGVMEKVWQRDGTIHVNCDNGLGMFINDNFPNEFKPILRPLSDLTNDTFDFIYNTECDYPSIKKWIELDSESRLSCKFSYKFWELLYQYHFDINGLIEKGLAIDINTLNKQP